MKAVTLWHNPRCSKSRQALELLRERGLEPRVVEYLKDPPSAQELGRVLKLLGMEPRDLIRKKEPPYRELGLADASMGRDALIAAMVEHPILIERPVVIAGSRAVLARPPGLALALLS
jgi:arsenate reductase (glutaredoxin)